MAAPGLWPETDEEAYAREQRLKSGAERAGLAASEARLAHARVSQTLARDRDFGVPAAQPPESVARLFEGNAPSLGAMSFASPALVPGVAPLEGHFAFQQLATPSPFLDKRQPDYATADFSSSPAAPQPAARAPMAYAPRPAAAPSPIAPEYGGTYFEPAKYDAAIASGKLKPEQIAAYQAAKARAGATPLGLTAEGMLIDSAKRKADLVAAGAEQTSLANALERDSKAQEAAAVTEREQIASYEKMRSEFDTSQANRVAQMDSMKADISATKIDPSQYFSKGNAFGNVLSLLAVALGGYAEGFSGGRLKNNALAMLQNSIDNDIAAQKANLDNKKTALGAAQSIYGLARQQFGDDQQAAEFTRARQNDILKTQALRFATDGRTEAIRANAKKLAEHLDLESQGADNRVKLLNANAEAQRIAAAHRGGGGGATPEEKQFDKDLALRSRLAGVRKSEAEATKSEREARGEGEDHKDKEIISFEGADYLVPKVGAKELRESAGSAMATQEQADTMLKLAKGDYHTLFGTTDAKAQGELVRAALIAGVARVKSSGFNPSKEAEESAKELVPDVPYVFGSEAFNTTIKEIPALARAQVRKQLEAAGAKRLDGASASKPIKRYTGRN